VLPSNTIEIVESKYRAALAGEAHTFEAPFGGRIYLAHTLPLRNDQGEIFAGMAVTQDITERKRAEARLRASEARLDNILNTAADAIIALDEHQRILLFNQGAQRIFGYSADEVRGQPLDLLLPPRFAHAHREHILAFAAAPELARHMAERREVFGRRKDGTEFPAEASISKSALDGAVTFTVILRDITERKRSEEALHRWAHIFEHAEWGVAIGGADGHVLEMMNPAYARMHGYTVDELVGQPIASVFAPGTQDELNKLIRVANEAGHAVHESTHIRKDGTTFPVLVDLTAVRDEAGQLLYRVANVQDITERKRVEAEFQASEERFRSLVEISPVGVIILSPEGNFRYVSPAYEQNTGYTSAELLGQPVFRVVHPDDLPTIGDKFEFLIQHPERIVSAEYHHIRKDGSMRIMDATGTVLPNGDIVGYVQDITERKRSEEALRQSQQQYEQLVNSIDGIVWEGDAQTFEFSFVSRQAERILGYPAERWVSEPTFWKDHIHPDDRDGAVSYCAQATAEKRAHEFEYRMFAADGRIVWLRDIVTVVVENDEPKLLRGLMIDITERKRTEEALQTSEARFRSAFDDAAVGMALVLPDETFLRLNRAYCDLVGYTEAELQGKSRRTITHPDDVAADAARFKQLLSGAIDHYQMEKRYIHKRGHVLWTLLNVSLVRDANGRPLYTVSQVQDITERKQAEQALREREAQYRSIFEATTDGLVINDPETGVVVEANPAFCRMNGYSRDEIIGLHPRTFIHPDYHYLFGEYLETVRAGGHFRAQAMNVRKDGTPFHVEVHGTGFLYKGKPHILGVVRDISEHVQAQQLLEQRVEERTHELSTLLDVSRNVVSTLELEPLLGLILDQLKALVDYDGAALLTLQGDALVVLDYRGPIPRDHALQGRFPLERSTLDQEIIRHREPIIIGDIRDDTAFARAFRESAGAYLETFFGYIRSWLGVPLMIKERAIGIMTLDHSQPHYYTEPHARLATAIANQAAIAIENARLFAEAQDRAVLEERQRLARDLHDSVTQSLYSLTLLAEAGRRLAEADDVRQAGQYLGDIGEIAEQALKEMRLLVYQLRPQALEQEGLIGALQARLDSVEKRAGVDARFLIEGSLGSLPSALEEGLFRIAQEALNNALKHAAARAMLVRLCGGDEHVTLEVSDNGRGADLLTTGAKGGLGLTGMKERAAKLRGTLTVHSAPGEGTRVIVEVPRHDADAA